MKADEIKKLRNKMGLTQQDFGVLVGVGPATVNRWEMGHAKPSRMAVKSIQTIISQMNAKLKGHGLCL